MRLLTGLILSSTAAKENVLLIAGPNVEAAIVPVVNKAVERAPHCRKDKSISRNGCPPRVCAGEDDENCFRYVHSVAKNRA